MANTALTEYLQFHSQQSSSGCITLRGQQGSAAVYLSHGNVVHAEMGKESGLFAFYTVLGWEDVRIDWSADQLTPQISFESTIDALLYQYARLEDNKQTDEMALKAFCWETQPDTLGIKLGLLKSYLISFETVNLTGLTNIHFSLEKPETLIGRSSECDVVLPDAVVSSQHCKIILEYNCIRVIDLGSTNGTWINGDLISDSLLQVGDELCLGSLVLRMSMKLQRYLGQSSPGVLPQLKELETTSSNAAQKRAPISWKNINDDPHPKSSMSGLMGRLFKK